MIARDISKVASYFFFIGWRSNMQEREGNRGVSGAILRGEAVEKPYGAMVNSF
jgi:hypothetical protein